jgi:hypothetical protein
MHEDLSNKLRNASRTETTCRRKLWNVEILDFMLAIFFVYQSCGLESYIASPHCIGRIDLEGSHSSKGLI